MSVSPESDPKQFLRVLLVEDEANTISVLSLFLSEIKECKFTVCASGKEALTKIPVESPDVVVFAHGLQGEDSLQVFSEIRQLFPKVYLLVSLPESDMDLAAQYVTAGAVECLVKDKSYILKLVYSVKNAMKRVAERESFVLPPMPRAEQLSIDENLPDIVFILDADGKFLHANRVVLEVLGYEPSTLVQRPFIEFMDARNSSAFHSFIQSSQPGKNFQDQVSLRKKNGHNEMFDLNCTEIEDFLIYGVARPKKIYKQTQRASTRIKEEASPLSEDSLPPMIGPYRIVTLLGAGSTGRVYKGYDEQLDRHVAIKVISKVLHSDTEHLERFHREAKILASITHPNIALVYYFGNLQGLPYFCMEFLPGGSLETLLQKEGKIPAEIAVSYTMQVALGLHEAYKKGVVHLDIKPSNLMIAENERIKIVDFGFARKTMQQESSNEDSGAEPKAIPANFRVDVYSLGITFYRLLYGTTPHGPGGQTLELNDEKKLAPEIPPMLLELAGKMISRDPATQFQDYPELIEHLEKARRSFIRETEPLQVSASPDVPAIMRGLVFDTPFPEILGKIFQQNLTGKLTISWIDICKNVYFREGVIVGVLSNQEGESFVEALVRMNLLTGRKARRASESNYDLLKSYSWALREISPDVRDRVLHEMKQLAMQTLQGMFSLVVGEYLFDPSKFRGELTLKIASDELIIKGVKNWVDKNLIRRRLLEKEFRIQKNPDHRKLLVSTKIQPSDTFLIFRFEDSIHFQDLQASAGITEDECLKLIYLYKCFDLIEIIPEKYTGPPKTQPVRSQAVRPTTTVRPATPPKPAPVPPAPVPSPPPIPQKAQEPKVQAQAPISPPAAIPPPAVPDLSQGSAAEASPKDDGNYFYHYKRYAEESFENGNYWATVEYCKKALLYKKDASIFCLMGNALSTHPKFRSEAMEAYKKALQIDPKNPAIFSGMGDLYFLTGSLKLAKAKYEEVLDRDPDDSHAKERIAEILRKL